MSMFVEGVESFTTENTEAAEERIGVSTRSVSSASSLVQTACGAGNKYMKYREGLGRNAENVAQEVYKEAFARVIRPFSKNVAGVVGSYALDRARVSASRKTAGVVNLEMSRRVAAAGEQ